MAESKDAKPAIRVLIVDDDGQTRDILSRWLTREGYAPLQAASGAACLEMVAREDVDVIVMDVMMPNMDGLQICERLRADARWREIPVLLVTARDDLETRRRGMAIGVSEYLTKPVNKQQLFSRLRAQADIRALERRLSRTAAAVGAKP